MIKIYCLVDPRNNSPFYVGATKVQLKSRLSAHIREATVFRLKPYAQPLITDSKHLLIKDLVSAGLRPRIDLLYTTELITVEHYESFFHKMLIHQGFSIYNSPSQFNYLKYTKIPWYKYDRKYLK